MPENLPESLKQKISDRLCFYEDIGVGPFYRDRAGVLHAREPQATATIDTQMSQLQEPSLPKRESKALPHVQTAAVPSRKIEPLRADTGLSLFESKIENDTVLKIREDLGDCKRCRLHKTRHSIVFGDGNPRAELVFVGEGPGADEDEQGLPFVGRAGKLLTQMIE